MRKTGLYASWIVAGIIILALTTHVSTTSFVLDWFFVSMLYLTLSLLLSWTQFQPRTFLRIAGMIGMVFVYGLGYLSGTVGALGVALVVGSEEPQTEQWLEKGLIYKEILVGNAISDYRGKRIELYKTIAWCPVVEWRTQTKYYEKSIVWRNKLQVRYIPATHTLYVYASEQLHSGKPPETWADTLVIH